MNVITYLKYGKRDIRFVANFAWGIKNVTEYGIVLHELLSPLAQALNDFGL